jgi:hypothetical protein
MPVPPPFERFVYFFGGCHASLITLATVYLLLVQLCNNRRLFASWGLCPIELSWRIVVDTSPPLPNHGEIQQVEGGYRSFYDYPLDLLLTTQREQDAGTGVQPFLPPVSASGAPIPVLAYKSIAYIVATFKLALLVVIGIAYALLVALPETLLVSMVWPSSKLHTQAESVGLRAGIPA